MNNQYQMCIKIKIYLFIYLFINSNDYVHTNPYIMIEVEKVNGGIAVNVYGDHKKGTGYRLFVA